MKKITNLSELMMGKDEKDIAVLLYIYENKIYREYDKDNFPYIYEKHHNPIEIYNPDTKTRKMILDYIGSNMQVKEKSVDVKYDGEFILLKLIPSLTGLKVDYDLKTKKGKKQLEEDIKNPKPIMISIRTEIEKVCNQIFLEFYENFKLGLDIPKELRDAMSIQNGNFDVVKDLEIDDEISNEE